VGSAPAFPERWENKVVLVSFFATWCFPCLVEIPVLQKLHESYADKGLIVILAGMDLEGEKTLKPYSEMSNLSFPVVMASEWLKSGNTWLGRIQELPTHLLINRQGEVVFVKAGSFSPEVLDDFKKWFR
jgi:thiol-disulfide isomerase/thioredoxin